NLRPLPPAAADDLLDVQRHAMPAFVIEGYDLIREIARGGQGVVYLASERSTKASVAVKVLREGPFAGPADQRRFEREIRTLSKLKHPNIVAMTSNGESAGYFYFVMEFIEGLPLIEYCESTALSQDGMLRLFRKICEAVQQAHAVGIIHRD